MGYLIENFDGGHHGPDGVSSKCQEDEIRCQALHPLRILVLFSDPAYEQIFQTVKRAVTVDDATRRSVPEQGSQNVICGFAQFGIES